MNLRNQVIWITGASSGIGEALAYALAKEGARLILSARNREALERVKEACLPVQAVVLPLDLADAASMSAKVEEAVAAFGRVDVMVHNGGISQRGYLANTSLAVDRQLMEVNFFGTVALTKSLLPHFIKQRSGYFVVVTSLVGKFGTPMRSTYAASKHALHGFFESLRAEHYADGIKVSLVCPGFIKTQVSVNALTESGAKQNTMDQAQANGMLPEVFARHMVRAMEKQKEEVYIGGLREVAGVYLKRWWPSLFSRVLRKAKVT
ncbi:SDR family oxidoreductase [Cytophagales bacterium LB-30]|uniref:SDR family oxidoreductase n=1 Tax=Shiella aurantiaca TaxID=3058365 RepID=A0ABT8F2M6_9BACT|nr:SDR family oxidoreductase [Shiella aurantiaca]MDN4164519.1 SDR family oxidoreductase [Shiella aurantiaca]